jgi:hypothetical protein
MLRRCIAATAAICDRIQATTRRLAFPLPFLRFATVAMRGGKAKVAASKFSNQLPIDPARAARHVNADDFKVLSKKVKYCAPQWHLACMAPTHRLTSSLFNIAQ